MNHYQFFLESSKKTACASFATLLVDKVLVLEFGHPLLLFYEALGRLLVLLLSRTATPMLRRSSPQRSDGFVSKEVDPVWAPDPVLAEPGPPGTVKRSTGVGTVYHLADLTKLDESSTSATTTQLKVALKSKSKSNFVHFVLLTSFLSRSGLRGTESWTSIWSTLPLSG